MTLCIACGPAAMHESAATFGKSFVAEDEEGPKAARLAAALIDAVPDETVQVYRVETEWKRFLRKGPVRHLVAVDRAWPLGVQALKDSRRDGSGILSRVAILRSGRAATWSEEHGAYVEYEPKRSFPFRDESAIGNLLLEAASLRNVTGWEKDARTMPERQTPALPSVTFASVASCSGGLIRHVDGKVAGCTNDPDCVGRDVRHESDPKWCYKCFGCCDYCGVHS